MCCTKNANRSLYCLMLVLCQGVVFSATQSLTADEVMVVTRQGKVVRRTGTIVDYKGRELTLRVAGRDTKISTETVRSINTERLAAHAQADERYLAEDYADALTLYRQAFRDEPRRWVKREVLADVVRCQQNLGRIAEACKNFTRLTADDPRTAYFSVAPLAWQAKASSQDVLSMVEPWISDSPRPDRQLLAASWMLNSSRRDLAVRTLRELGRNEFEPIAKLAVSQMWRAELTQLNPSRLAWWQQHLESMPRPLRAGSYYLLGQSLSQSGDADAAALAFLRLPMQYQDDVLKNTALYECGVLLAKSGDQEGAKRCLQQLVRGRSALSEKARLRLEQWADGSAE